MPDQPAIAVALHDIAPATYERCALIRDWLDDHGIAKVTLLVTPASDLHPFADRRPELAEWLAERVGRGDAVAQHGFQHNPLGRPAGRRRASADGAAEFAGLDEAEARRAVEAGRRVLRLAGVPPRGFVAPAYAYTAALRRALAGSFEWWASGRSLRIAESGSVTRAPVFRLGAGRPTSPLAIRAGAWRAGPLLRLDLHPGDLDHPRRIGAIEEVLRQSSSRTAMTYDEVAELGRDVSPGRAAPPRAAVP